MLVCVLLFSWENYLKGCWNHLIFKSQSVFCSSYVQGFFYQKAGQKRVVRGRLCLRNSLTQYILQCSNTKFLPLFSLTIEVPKDSTHLLCKCIQTSELGIFIIPRVCFICVWRCWVLWNSSIYLTAKKQVCAYMTFQKKAGGQNGTPFFYLRLGLLVCSPVTSSL